MNSCTAAFVISGKPTALGALPSLLPQAIGSDLTREEESELFAAVSPLKWAACLPPANWAAGPAAVMPGVTEVALHT